MTTKAEELFGAYRTALLRVQKEDPRLGISDVPDKADEDGDLIFRGAMGTFYFSLDGDKDPSFLNLVYPNFQEIAPEDRAKALETCHSVNRKVKCVKLYLNQAGDGTTNATSSVQMFVSGQNKMPSAEYLASVLSRIIIVVLQGAKEFSEEFQSGDSKDEAVPGEVGGGGRTV